MFENLQERFERAFKVLKGHGSITEVNVGDTLKEVRKALLDADVDYKTAKNFVKTVKEKALGREVLTSIQPGQLLIKITHEELTKLMGQAAAPLELKGKPATILLAGLQGAGKTTHAGKLAARIAKSGRKPLLVACDVHRPAAVDQLTVVGESVGADVYSEPGVKDAILVKKVKDFELDTDELCGVFPHVWAYRTIDGALQERNCSGGSWIRAS